MSIAHSTFFITKFKSFFFVPLSFSGWLIIWPGGISYGAWQNLLKSYLCFIGLYEHIPIRKSKRKRKPSRRLRQFLRIKIQQKNEIIEKQTEAIIDDLFFQRSSGIEIFQTASTSYARRFFSSSG